MTAPRRAIELIAPWGGLIGAGLGWGLTHQLGSNLSFDHCALLSPLLALLIGLAGVAAAAGGGLLSWRVRRRGEAGTGARAFVSLVSMLAAALFSIALFWQTLSSLIIPRCYG